MALFGERYGDSVRVVSVHGVSSELCGGTHCRATGDIGLFVIVSEGSVSSGIRRIEGFTGSTAFHYLRERTLELKKIDALLKTDRAYPKIERLLSEIKALEREREEVKARTAVKDASAIIESARTINGIVVISHRVDGLEQKDLRTLADSLRDKIGSGIIFIASAKDSQASMLAVVTKDLVGRFSAGEILKEIAAMTGGRGGGKAEMAQGGTSRLDALDSAVESVYGIIRERSSAAIG